MATNNKDFKVKHGLIVEGASATVNGNQVLTEVASDEYILDLIGGETLVKSVSSEFDVSAGGELSLDREVVDAYYDAAGSADLAEAAANSYTNDRESAITTAYQSYADTAEADAIAAAALDATAKADTAEDNAIAAAALDATAKADTAEDNAIAAAALDATDKADAAEAAAIAAAALDATEKANAAQAAAELHADEAIADLVNGAPELLDTLNELAAALQDNPDVITDLQDIAAGKQDTLTPGDNIDITGSTISVTGLDSADISDFSTAAVTANTGLWDTLGDAAAAQAAAELYADGLAVNYDAAGAAATAQANAIAHADALTTDDVQEGEVNEYFTDSRAKASAGDLLAGATTDNVVITYTGGVLSIAAENGVADSTTDDLVEGEDNLYFNDERAIDAVSGADIYPNAVIINNLTKQVANQVTVATAGIATGISWAKADYRSAEFVVKVAYGDHTEISKVLLTLDVNDNISITEYGNVTTNGSASSISADISGTDARLRVTTVNNASTVTVLGTLIK
jgi:hypothetical protein